MKDWDAILKSNKQTNKPKQKAKHKKKQTLSLSRLLHRSIYESISFSLDIVIKVYTFSKRIHNFLIFWSFLNTNNNNNNNPKSRTKQLHKNQLYQSKNL